MDGGCGGSSTPQPAPTCHSDASCSHGWGRAPTTQTQSKQTTAANTKSQATSASVSALLLTTQNQNTQDAINFDPASMVFFGAGVLAGVALVVASFLNPGLLAEATSIAVIFGGNPLTAIMGEVSATLLAASLFLHYLDDALQLGGHEGSTFDARVENLHKRVDALLFAATLVLAASRIGGVLGAVAGLVEGAPAILAAIVGIVAQVGAVFGAGAAYQADPDIRVQAP
jgi:hypothetical protein